MHRLSYQTRVIEVLMGWTTPAPGIDVPKVVVAERHKRGEPSAMKVATIGLDLAKHWFQVHGVDASGQQASRVCVDGPFGARVGGVEI